MSFRVASISLRYPSAHHGARTHRSCSRSPRPCPQPATFMLPVSLQCELADMKSLREPIRRPALDAAQTGESGKRFGIEPVLGTLRAEMRKKQFDFSRHYNSGGRDVDVWPGEVTVPLWNFIFQDEVVA